MNEIVKNLFNLYSEQKTLSDKINKLESNITKEANDYFGCAIRYDKMANTNIVLSHFIFYKKWAISFFQYYSIDQDLFSTTTNWQVRSHIDKDLLIEMYDKEPFSTNKINILKIKHKEFKDFSLLTKLDHKNTDLTDYVNICEKNTFDFLESNTDLTIKEIDTLKVAINRNSIYLTKLLNRVINGYQHEDFNVSKLTSTRELQLLNIFAKLGEFSMEHKNNYLLNKLTNELSNDKVDIPVVKI